MAKPSHNAPFFLALQVVPSIAWGGTGVGKSASMEALAKALDRTFVPLLGATMAPEDLGGFPLPDYKAGVVRQMPASWADRTKDGKALVFCDEVTNVPSAVQAGMLSVLTERRVGDYQMPASTLFAAAANPPELCPNAVPLAPAMRSRFAHFDWHIDYEHWFAGLRGGCDWGAPEFPVVPPNWQDSLPQFGALVEAFLRSAPDCREKLPEDDETMSFPTLRTWHYLVRCFAAAQAAGYDSNSSIFKQLAFACVGDAAGSEFVRYWHHLDLVNPESILTGESKFEYVKRPDVLLCLLTGLVAGLRTNTSKDRWLRAAEVFIAVGTKEIELFLLAFKPFWKSVKDGGVRPDGFVPPKPVLDRIMQLVKT